MISSFHQFSRVPAGQGLVGFILILILIPTILGLITINYENPQSPTIISSIFRILTLLTKAEHAAQLLNANSGL